MNSSRKHLISLTVWCGAALLLLARCGNCQESMILAGNPEANTGSPVELNPDWPIIHTPSMKIGYEINSFNINNLDRIELWYARGLSGRWQFYDYDQDRTSPVTFTAPAEGIYRFLVVAVDRWGRKSCQTNQNHDDVSSNTLPDDLPAHLTVFVDYSGKIHLAAGQPTQDTLPATPVLPETPPAVPVSKTPEKVKDAQEEDAQDNKPLGNKEHSDLSGAPFQPKPKLPESKKLERASQCFSRGMMYCQQMEWPKAIEAFQESLENNPQSLNCRTNLANALFKMCRFEEALYQYQICLKEEPARSSALFGLAQTQIALKQHQNAQKTLTRLLEQDRRDWQAWLLYGDASQQLGNVSLAVNSWQQAAQGDANIARLAQERIKQYQP